MLLFTICDLFILFYIFCTSKIHSKSIHEIPFAHFPPLLCIVFSQFFLLSWSGILFLVPFAADTVDKCGHFTATDGKFSSANFPRNNF